MGFLGFGKKQLDSTVAERQKNLKRLTKDEKTMNQLRKKMSRDERQILVSESQEMKFIREAEDSFNDGQIGIHKLLNANIPIKELDDAIENYAEDMDNAASKMSLLRNRLAAFEDDAELLDKLGINLEQKAKEISVITKSNFSVQFEALINTDHQVLETNKGLVGEIQKIENTLRTIYIELEDFVRSKNNKEVHQKLLQEYNNRISSVAEMFLNVKKTIRRIVIVSRQVQERLVLIKTKTTELERFIKQGEHTIEEAKHIEGGYDR